MLDDRIIKAYMETGPTPVAPMDKPPDEKMYTAAEVDRLVAEKLEELKAEMTSPAAEPEEAGSEEAAESEDE